MNSLFEKWSGFDQRMKIGIGIGTVLIVAFVIALGVWAYRTDYQVLFADLSPRDASTMTAELERMKTPYQLTDGGNTILVPQDLVYKTRLKLMGKELPLHGSVGFEVFNNADFGMTEFVQKVNYQRAIQGELTRTVLSIEDIQSARVHLAIPEQGLFKKSNAKPKASVTLAMKAGRTLAPEQVAGIQRLVAASVPDIAAEDVTVLDQHGVALTRPAGAESAIGMSTTQLDSKRMTEEYLLRKVSQVLDRTLGPGEAVASIDVSINMDQSRVTTEEVLPAKSAGPDEGPAAGVIVRERQTTRESSGGSGTSNGRRSEPGVLTTVESDYQVGRRVEQVVSGAGALQRMTVAVVVKKPLSEAQLEKLKEVVGLAVGIHRERGDAVVVYSVEQLASGAQPGPVAEAGAADMHQPTVAGKPPADRQQDTDAAPTDHSAATAQVLGGIVAAFLIALAVVGVFRLQRHRTNTTAVSRLTGPERERMLRNVQQWILQDPVISDNASGSRK